MSDPRDPAAGPSGDSPSDEMAQYLQVYIDESEEELDGLVEALLRLEVNPRDAEALHKSFRMLHSLKGSSGMLGFETIAGFAHELEDRFERYRSGLATLDRDTATLVLKCVDFLKAFVDRLRAGDQSEGDPLPLLERLRKLEARGVPEAARSAAPLEARPQLPALTMSGGVKLVVRFRPGLQLADLKARLIVSRLSSLGEILGCDPPIDDAHSFDELPLFSLVLVTDRGIDEVRKVANVDGVESIEIQGSAAATPSHGVEQSPSLTARAQASQADAPSNELAAPAASSESDAVAASTVDESSEAKGQVSESLRVDIGRLDDLLNLTGELVVAQARFAKISDDMSPMFRRGGASKRSRELLDRLRQRFDAIRGASGEANGNSPDLLHGLDEDLDLLDQQSQFWEEGHRCFAGITDATDQLLRVSKNLQRGVLSTRMVPVGPLFSRFRRVVRDLSVSRRKQVHLAIQGEKTELDKRMIDALGDPLLHLVRNSIDHGLESPEERRAAGKPELGTVRLEAVHRGNNVLIMVCDDGGGINTERIRARVVERGLASSAHVQELSEQQLLDYIWHPGFSTAETVTEVSGRGVGMDIVQSAITSLGGIIEVSSAAGMGTTFTIRLPLTLAIIHSLLIQFQGSHYSIPIDDVQEIVSVPNEQVHEVHRYSTIDVRGELIPLVDMEGVFDWNAQTPSQQSASPGSRQVNLINVVILQARGKKLGLRVDTLVGRADIVIKSLTENFAPVRGLSGASVLGDGAVCLMLDTLSLIDLAGERTTRRSVVQSAT